MQTTMAAMPDAGNTFLLGAAEVANLPLGQADAGMSQLMRADQMGIWGRRVSLCCLSIHRRTGLTAVQLVARTRCLLTCGGRYQQVD